FGERTLGREGVGNIAERVLVGIEAAILRHVDAPMHDILAVMIARGEAQGLDHAADRRVVVVAGLVRDANAHCVPEGAAGNQACCAVRFPCVMLRTTPASRRSSITTTLKFITSVSETASPIAL